MKRPRYVTGASFFFQKKSIEAGTDILQGQLEVFLHRPDRQAEPGGDFRRGQVFLAAEPVDFLAAVRQQRNGRIQSGKGLIEQHMLLRLRTGVRQDGGVFHPPDAGLPLGFQDVHRFVPGADKEPVFHGPACFGQGFPVQEQPRENILDHILRPLRILEEPGHKMEELRRITPIQRLESRCIAFCGPAEQDPVRLGFVEGTIHGAGR